MDRAQSRANSGRCVLPGGLHYFIIHTTAAVSLSLSPTLTSSLHMPRLPHYPAALPPAAASTLVGGEARAAWPLRRHPGPSPRWPPSGSLQSGRAKGGRGPLCTCPALAAWRHARAEISTGGFTLFNTFFCVFVPVCTQGTRARTRDVGAARQVGAVLVGRRLGGVVDVAHNLLQLLSHLHTPKKQCAAWVVAGQGCRTGGQRMAAPKMPLLRH